MKQGIYCIHDSKAEYYLPPFTVRTDAEAQRMFADIVAKSGTALHDHPEDFCLYRVGSFNLATGEVASEPHLSLGKALDFVKKEGVEENA